MSGGFNSYSSEHSSPERLANLRTAIKKLGADIIGLVDTFRWDQIYTETDLKKLFNYKHAYCINLNDERLKTLGHNNGITLLSNFEIIEPLSIRLATRNAIKVRVQANNPFTLVIAYLDDISDDARLRQLRALRSLIDPKMRLLIMGDINATKSSDVIDATTQLERFYVENPEIAKKLKPVINDILYSKVIDQLESWGLRDADQELHRPTFPTPLFPAKTHRPILRPDYCFYSPQLSVGKFNVPYDDIFKKSSDHFPIVFDVE